MDRSDGVRGPRLGCGVQRGLQGMQLKLDMLESLVLGM